MVIVTAFETITAATTSTKDSAFLRFRRCMFPLADQTLKSHSSASFLSPAQPWAGMWMHLQRAIWQQVLARHLYPTRM